MTATTKPVDVFDAWDCMADSIANRRDECIERGQHLQADLYRSMLAGHNQSRAAIAELIAADVEYDEAWIAWRNGPKNMQSDHPIVVRLGAAKERRAAALAAIQGENGGGGHD